MFLEISGKRCLPEKIGFLAGQRARIPNYRGCLSVTLLYFRLLNGVYLAMPTQDAMEERHKER